MYDVTLVNRDEKTAASRGTNALDTGTLRLSGGFLMAHGVDLPNHFCPLCKEEGVGDEFALGEL